MNTSRRGHIDLIIGETQVHSVNGTITRHVEHDTSGEERAIIWGVRFAYRTPYYVSLDRGLGLGGHPRRWIAYPVTPSRLVVRGLFPGEGQVARRRYTLETYAGTEVYRYWLAQMAEHPPLRISMTVHVFSVCFVFEVLTEEFRYRLFLRRLR